MINEIKTTEYWISCDECERPFALWAKDNIQYDSDYLRLLDLAARHHHWTMLRAKDDTGNKIFCGIKCMLKFMETHPEYTSEDIIDAKSKSY